MDKQQLGRAILCVLGRLLLSNAADVPDHDAAVGAAAGKDGLVEGVPVHLEHLIRVVLERVELLLHVARVPHGHRLVGRSSGEVVLGGRVEAQAVNLCRVRLHAVHRLLRVPRVPQQEELVIAHGAKVRLVVQVPRYVLDDVGVALELEESVDGGACLGRGLGDIGTDVPETDGLVVGGAEEVALLERRPREAVALALVAAETEQRSALRTLRPRLELGVVEDEHLGGGRLRGDDRRLLRHVARAVYLALVVDPLADLHLHVWVRRIAAQLSALFAVLLDVHLRVVLGQAHLRNEEVVALGVAGVRAQQQLLLREVRHDVLVGQPLAGERRPLKGMGDEEVVEEGRVLLPYLVLLVDLLLLVRFALHLR
mmetsp:Transcript_19171/g.73667  ORF Transcript_19171/g.73667 Transcript_19171/m.73667 type:complete len:369 (+) Transcript_19171:256-1362(+)